MANDPQDFSGNIEVDSIFSVDSERKIDQSRPIFVESEEDSKVDIQRKHEISKILTPEIIIRTAKLFFSRNANYEICKIKQQSIKDSLDLISHTANQAEYKMQNEIEASFDPTSEINEALRSLKNRDLVEEIDQYSQIALDTANILHLNPSSSKAFTKTNQIKFPTVLDESYIELTMTQSIDRANHMIKVVNKSSYDWTSLLLYEEQTKTKHKTIPKLLANSECSLTLTFQYDSLTEFKTLRFKILAFSRPVSNTCIVGLYSIASLIENEDSYSFEIVSHVHFQLTPELYYWAEDSPDRVESKPLPKFKSFAKQKFKKLPKIPGHQLCVELRLEGVSSSRVYKF